jgi:Peptidase family M48
MNHGSGPNMMRYGVAAVVFGLYAATSTWIIRGEGEVHRNALRVEVLLAEVDADPAPTRAMRPPAPESKPASPAVEEALLDRATQPAPEPTSTPAPKPTSIPVAPASTPPPIPAAERTPLRPSVEATPETQTQASPPDPFWAQPEQKKAWDLGHLSIEDERRLGAELHRMVLRYHKPLEVGPLPGRLEGAAEPYLASCSRKGLSYTFTVLDCDESNAFSHPGGYVYVCRGLFDWIAEEEDYALEFVVVHEMAHVDLAHAADCLRDPEVKKLDTGTVPLFYALAIPWGYKPEQDVEADRWAALRMRQAGRSRHDTMAFLRKLEDYARKHGFENVRRKPGEDPGLSPLDNHLRAHPIPRKRIKELGAFLDAPPKPR